MRDNERRVSPREDPPNASADRTRRPRRGVGALVSLGAAATFATVALLLIVTPLAAATSVATFTAPYGGKSVNTSSSSAQGCGASVTVGHKPTFNRTLGAGHVKAATSAGACTSADSQAGYDAWMGVSGLSFKAAVSGSHTVTASWKVSWSGSLSMSAGAAAAGGQATVEVYLTTVVKDTTTSTSYSAPTVFLYQKDLTAAGTLSVGSVGSSGTSTIAALALASGHSYTITVEIVVDLQATVPQGAASGSAAGASVDLTSGSYGAVLSSVVVS